MKKTNKQTNKQKQNTRPKKKNKNKKRQSTVKSTVQYLYNIVDLGALISPPPTWSRGYSFAVYFILS